jgi:hypothetical protein
VFQLQVTPTSFWITLFSSTFIHTGCAHILGNMLFLFVVGLHVERWIGWFSPISPLSDLRLGRERLRDRDRCGFKRLRVRRQRRHRGVLAAYLGLYPSNHVRTLIPLGIPVLDCAGTRPSVVQRRQLKTLRSRTEIAAAAI